MVLLYWAKLEKIKEKVIPRPCYIASMVLLYWGKFEKTKEKVIPRS